MQGNLGSLYDTFHVTMPKRVKVSEYLVYQFEHSNFNFDAVQDEDRLQDRFEEMMEKELLVTETADGERHANRNERARTKNAKKRRMD